MLLHNYFNLHAIKALDTLKLSIKILIISFLNSLLIGTVYADNSEQTEITLDDSINLVAQPVEPYQNKKDTTQSVVAPNIDLKEVAPPPETLLEPDTKVSTPNHVDFNTHPKEPVDSNSTFPLAINTESEKTNTTFSTTPNNMNKPSLSSPNNFIILGAEVPPSTSTRLGWTPGIAIAGLATPVPVLVVNGKNPGKTFCLMAAIHGDELNGIEVVRRVIYELDPTKLAGRVIGVPIVNLQGFQRNSRYLADRRDLNRYFPGTSQGSLAARIAYSLFKEVIIHCDALVDLHTGSLRRTNLPQLRADMTDPQAIEFTEFFDDIVVVHSPGKKGMLRWAAAEQNIPSVTLEIGESNRLQEAQVEIGVKSINSLLDRLGMYERLFTWGEPEPVYYQSTWVRAQRGGILFSVAGLGSNVTKGDILGNVTDPITNEVSKIKAPYDGRIIGMAVNQVVMPGFAAYHLGIEASEIEVSNAANQHLEDADMDDIENQPE